MKDLVNIKKKLIQYGFRVYLSKIDNTDYLRGGHESSLDSEIWIRIDNDKFIFFDFINQKLKEKEFENEHEIITYILKKFNIN